MDIYQFWHTVVLLRTLSVLQTSAGRGSSIGCAFVWYADGRGFDPHVRQHSFILSAGQEIISTAILSLPLIQEGQIERELSTGKLHRRLAQEQCG